MIRDPINENRYRTLRLALPLAALMSALGSLGLYRLPGAPPQEWTIFVAGAAAYLLLLPFARAARTRQSRAGLDRVAWLAIALSAGLLLERVFSSFATPSILTPSVSLFRPTFAFTPILYLGAVALLRARVALRLCWAIWGAQLAIALPGLWIYTGFSPEQEGLIGLAAWLLVGNPLIILLMHALPHYEDALDQSKAELRQMRSRTELMGQLEVSERRFNLVVEGLQVGVWDRWIGDEEQRWWSPKFYELIGYTPDELDPTEDNLRNLLHPEDRDVVWKQGTEQLARGDIMDVNFRINTKHKGYRWFNSHAKAERDERGRLVRLAGAISDIHDQRTAEEALQQAKVELTRLAFRDPVTGLHNRRAFDDHFYNEWQRAVRYGRPLSLLIIDLDHFKAYNDRRGHAAGDECLAKIGRAIQDSVRKAADFVARVGGEEFAALLPETDEAGAMEVARKVRSAVRELVLPHPGSPMEIVTVSVGASSMVPPSTDTTTTLYDLADKALYHVKRCGRDDVLHINTLKPAPGAAA